MDDVISRQAAIDALRSMQTYKLFAGDDMLLIDQTGAQTELMLLPSAQTMRKKGRWKRRLVDSGFNADWHCSECGWETAIEEHGYNYCPNCGADMRGTDEHQT